MSAATTYINGLLYDARCFRCLPEATHFEIQTYILSVIAGGSTDPAVLVNQARSLAALSWDSLTEIKVYLLAVDAGFDPDPNSLLTGAKCFSCIPQGMFTEVQTYLLAQDPGGPGITNPNSLAQAAKAFQSLDPYDLLQIQVMLIAQIAGVSVDANALIQAAKCMKCIPQPTLVTVWIATLDFLEPIPADSPRVSLPPPDPPPPPPGQPPPGRGGGIVPHCTDTLAHLTPSLSAHYVSGSVDTIDLLIQRTCCNGGTYQIYGSNDSGMAGAVLLITAAIPARTGHYTVAGIDVSLYGYAFYAAKTVCTGGITTGFSNIVGSAQILSPLDIAGVKVWYDGSDSTTLLDGIGNPVAPNGTVTTWKDKSGHLRDLSVVSVNLPIRRTAIRNGRDVVEFGNPGTSGMHSLAENISSSNSFTIFVVAFAPAGSVVQCNSWVRYQNIDGAYVLCPYTIGVNAVVCSSDAAIGASPAINVFTEAWQMLGMTRQINQVSGLGAWLGGILQNSINTANAAPPNRTLGVGFAEWNGGEGSVGYIAEIIIYDTSLSTSDRMKVEAFLQAKWAMAIRGTLAVEDFESYPNGSAIIDGWDQGTGWSPGSIWLT